MIERLLRLAYSRRVTVLLGAGVLLAIALLLLTHLSFDSNILRLLPRQGPAVRGFDAYLRHFGTFDHIYVLFEVPPDSQISDHEAFIDRYVERLRKAPEIASVDAEMFDDVKDWNYLFDRELLLLGKDQARLALARFDPPEMADELTQARGLLAVSSPQVKAYVQQDPLGLLGLLRDRLGRGRSLVEFDPTQKGYVSRDGRSRLVMAQPVRPPFDTDFCKRLFDRLAEIEAGARAAAAEEGEASADTRPADVTVRVAGGYRIAIEAERVIRKELTINSIGSLVGLLLLVFIVFRTPWILVYGTVPLVIAALLTVGVNGLGGPLSPANSGTSAILFGLGIDGIVLMYLRYMEERGRGLSGEDAIARTSGTAASVMLAYGTTAATFLALLLVDLPSLQELGRLVGLGILVCGVLLLTLLPALISITSPKPRGRPLTSAWLGRLVERQGRAILVVAVILTLGLAAAAPRLRLNTSLEKLQARTEGSALEQVVAERFSLPHDVVIALGEGRELDSLLEEAHRFAAAVGRDMPSLVISAPDALLPPASQQNGVGAVLNEARLDAKSVAVRLAQEATAAGFRPGTFESFIERLPRMLDPSQRLTYQGLLDHNLAPLASHYVAPIPGGFLVAVYLYPRAPSDLDRLGPVITANAPSFRLTGIQSVNRELAARFLPQFLKGVIAGTLAVAALVFFVFRSVRRSLLAFLSTTLGFIWSAGLLALFNAELDLFSLFAAITFIGIATDYDIYVIYRYSVEGTRSIREVLTRTGPAIMVAGGTTLIGFGTLINSSYAPLRSFGIASVTMITASLIVSLLVLPALLQETSRP
jgi:predicted RND superfamily exporter protein